MRGIMLCDGRLAENVDDVTLQAQLGQHYAGFKGKPPLCLCTDIHVRMYIAKFGERYLLKRWPGSGHEHAVDCDRYEAPPEASGLGKLMGSAIREDMVTGDIELKLGFPLKKQPRTAVTADSVEAQGQESDLNESAASSTSKVSLRAVLHYLWDQAELTHWKPGMKNKRNWWVVQSRLLDAAARMTTKGLRLQKRLYIPEPFKPDAKEQIRLRRRGFFQSVASQKAARELLMFLFEVKEISPSPYGYKLVAKNVPDDNFYLTADLNKLLRKRFSTELEMFERADGQCHLMALGTLSVKPSGIVNIEEMTLMATTGDWIPVADQQEAVVVDYSVTTGRQFIKPLKYNMGAGRALAAMLYTDTPGQPTALYIVKPDDSDALIEARREMQGAGRSLSVEWHVADDPIPTSVIDAIPSARFERDLAKA